MSDADFSRRGLIGLGAAAVLAGTASAAKVRITPNVLSCPAGRFAGVSEGTVLAFKGIRYARAKRFQAPVREKAVRGTVAATTFGPIAPQGGLRDTPQSEDC